MDSDTDSLDYGGKVGAKIAFLVLFYNPNFLMNFLIGRMDFYRV